MLYDEARMALTKERLEDLRKEKKLSFEQLSKQLAERGVNISHKVSCPQILLRGDHDPVFPDGFQEWFSTHTNGIVKIVSDCGHYIHADKPQVFCQAVWNFIDCL